MYLDNKYKSTWCFVFFNFVYNIWLWSFSNIFLILFYLIIFFLITLFYFVLFILFAILIFTFFVICFFFLRVFFIDLKIIKIKRGRIDFQDQRKNQNYTWTVGDRLVQQKWKINMRTIRINIRKYQHILLFFDLFVDPIAILCSQYLF